MMDRANLDRYVERMTKRSRGAGGSRQPEGSSGGSGKRPPKALVWALVAVFIGLCVVSALGLSTGNRMETVSPSGFGGPVASEDPYRGLVDTSGNVAAMPTPETAMSDQESAYGAEASAGSPPNAQGATGGSTTQTQTQPWDRMIIRTATLQLTVGDVAASVDRVRLLAVMHGGYVFQLDSHKDGEYTVSSITIQVPGDEFDKIMPELRKLNGEVKEIVNENVSSSDVTEEYTDLNSQLRNLRATEGRLLVLQQQAVELDDILALDRELRQIQSEIERIQGRVNFLGKRAAMSSITIALSPEQVAVQLQPAVEPAWDPAAIARRAWEASLDLLSRVATVAITVAVFMWWTIPLSLLAFWVVIRIRKQPGAPPSPPAGEAPVSSS